MELPLNISTNKGKSLEIVTGGKRFIRIPIKTHLIKETDNIIEVVSRYLEGKIDKYDIVFVSEKVIAITQGKAIPLEQINARPLAKFLARFVTKTPAGIGIGIPETMEIALQECGVLRILIAAFIGSFMKICFQKQGYFYIIAGSKARTIDGPTCNTIAPYNTCVVPGPSNPTKVAQEISHALGGIKVVVCDINDLGGNILGGSHKELNYKELVAILRDNPLGQGKEQTPIGIIRQI